MLWNLFWRRWSLFWDHTLSPSLMKLLLNCRLDFVHLSSIVPSCSVQLSVPPWRYGCCLANSAGCWCTKERLLQVWIAVGWDDNYEVKWCESWFGSERCWIGIKHYHRHWWIYSSIAALTLFTCLLLCRPVLCCCLFFLNSNLRDLPAAGVAWLCLSLFSRSRSPCLVSTCFGALYEIP